MSKTQSTSSSPEAGASQRRQNIVVSPYSVAFVIIHLGCLAIFWTGLTLQGAGLGLALYIVRMFAISAGYHRYFAHRTFRASRTFQFVLAFLAQTSAQRGVLWWASKHREHHMHSDTEKDVHSPVLHGLVHAHIGWIFDFRNHETDYRTVSDLAKCSELLWLDRHSYLPVAALALLTWLVAGWCGLVVGFCCSTVAIWHVTFSINSVAHRVGRRRHVTGDSSRNNWLLALLTMGEGWHNNHHAYQASARQGFLWWEIDLTFYVLLGLSWIGVIWDLHVPPRTVLTGRQKLGRRVIDKAGYQIAVSLPIKSIVDEAIAALERAPNRSEVVAEIEAGTMSAEALWAKIGVPQIPTHEEVRHYTRVMLVQTPSLDDIARSARLTLLDLVYFEACQTVFHRDIRQPVR